MEADLVIGVGTRYTSRVAVAEIPAVRRIDVSEFEPHLKMEAVPVVADAKEALPRLEKLLEGLSLPCRMRSRSPRREWIDELGKSSDYITFSD